MDSRLGSALPRRWQAYLPDGSATPVASARLTRVVFGLWVLAFALKHAGSSWDVAWHFRFVFDPLEPPHVVIVAGSILALALLVFQVGTGRATEPTGLITTQIGMAIFLI